MRSASLLVFALCASVYSVGALPSDATGGKNYLADGDAHPCTNSFNGVDKSSTDLGDGNVIVGCGNTVANITDADHMAVKVNIYGSDNVVENDIVTSDSGSHDGINVGSNGASNGNTIVDNSADYIHIKEGDRNFVRHNAFAEHIVMDGASDNLVESNEMADRLYISRADGNIFSHNVVDVDYSNSILADSYNVTIESNDADYIYVYSATDTLFERNTGVHGTVQLIQTYHSVVNDNTAGASLVLDVSSSVAYACANPFRLLQTTS